MNELISQNNKQFQINQRINQRIQLITDTVNNALSTSTMANKITLTEIEMLTTILNIDTINTILEDIQEAILRTKLELASSRILSLKEIIMIKELLITQGINISLPDEALQYVTPKIAVNHETLLYILHVPKLQEQSSTALTIFPLILNNTIINNHPQQLIRSEHKLYSTRNYNNYVQRQADIQEFQDSCIKPLVLGTTSHCNVTSESETIMQFIAEDKLLINNAKNETLSSDCGPNNRTLEGNFLITFWNCTITFKNKKFQSLEIRSDAEELQGALHNIQATRQLISRLNIDEIVQGNIENRKQLQNVYLKQVDHQNWIWSLSGGVSISTIGILILFIYIGIRTPAAVIKLRNIGKTSTSTISIDEIKQSSDLLTRLGVKSKDEDALFSPPGGVMLT